MRKLHKGDLVLKKGTDKIGVVIYKRGNIIKVNFETIPFPKPWELMSREDIKQWEEENIRSAECLFTSEVTCP